MRSHGQRAAELHVRFCDSRSGWQDEDFVAKEDAGEGSSDSKVGQDLLRTEDNGEESPYIRITSLDHLKEQMKQVVNIPVSAVYC